MPLLQTFRPIRWHILGVVAAVSVIAMAAQQPLTSLQTRWVDDCVKRHTREVPTPTSIRQRCEYAGEVFFTKVPKGA